MHELFLKKILKTLQMNSARAGKKEGGWGEGIFARPRFPPLLFFAAAIFRISLYEMRRQKGSCVCPALVRTQQIYSLKIYFDHRFFILLGHQFHFPKSVAIAGTRIALTIKVSSNIPIATARPI